MLATNLSKVLYFWYQNEGAEYMENIIYYNIKDEPFGIYGLYNPKEEMFSRECLMMGKSHKQGCGIPRQGNSRWKNQIYNRPPYVAIKAEMPYVTNFPHMP